MRKAQTSQRPPALSAGQPQVFVAAWKKLTFPDKMFLSEANVVSEAATGRTLEPHFAQVITFLFKAANTGEPEHVCIDRFTSADRSCGMVPNCIGDGPPILFVRGNAGWTVLRTTLKEFNAAKAAAA